MRIGIIARAVSPLIPLAYHGTFPPGTNVAARSQLWYDTCAYEELFTYSTNSATGVTEFYAFCQDKAFSLALFGRLDRNNWKPLSNKPQA